MIISTLIKQGLISPPSFFNDERNIAYLVMSGSHAYGVNKPDSSDKDFAGFVMPNLIDVFPHIDGAIDGFGIKPAKFGTWSEHHINFNNIIHDFTIHSIVKFFNLAMENNPNVLELLFVPDNCVIRSSKIGQIIRENRRTFLHKGSFPKCKGYAFAQMSRYVGHKNQKIGYTISFMNDHNIPMKNIKANIVSGENLSHLSKIELEDYTNLISNLTDRNITVIEEGIDTKACYHVVRLVLQAEQILVEHDLDLQRNKEQLKSIRRGEWSIERIQTYFEDKERVLEDLYIKSTLRHTPDEEAIRKILMNCLEEHYGDLSHVVKPVAPISKLIDEIQQVIHKYV